jgi:hypothetical protein
MPLFHATSDGDTNATTHDAVVRRVYAESNPVLWQRNRPYVDKDSYVRAVCDAVGGTQFSCGTTVVVADGSPIVLDGIVHVPDGLIVVGILPNTYSRGTFYF